MKPPPAVLLPIVYGAGLATGLARFPAPWCAFGVLAFVVVLRLARAEAGWLACVAVLGAAAGWTERARDARSCSARLPEGRIGLRLHVQEPIPRGGGMAIAVPVAVVCAGHVMAWFPAGSAVAAGTVLAVEASWQRNTRRVAQAAGLLRVTSARSIAWRPGIQERLRNSVAGTSERLYGSRAPLVDALVVGRRSDMDRDLKTAFANSGLVHLLSISGFHIGVVGVWSVFVLRRVGVPLGRALLLSAVLATAYVDFLGWPPPAVRAVALAWALAWLRWRQRAVQPDALLATTALAVMLLDPWAVFDLGAWLSVLALWGAVRFARWAGQAGGTSWVARSAASSVGATVATAPLTAVTLGAVAPIGIVLNFVAIPLAAVAVPGVLASLLLDPLLPWAGGALAAGSGLALHGLEWVALRGGQVPYGHVITDPTAWSAFPWALLLVVMVWATPRQGQRSLAVRRLLVAATAGLWLTLWPGRVVPGGGEGKLTLHFLDVGQGDAALLRTPHGRFLLVDAGPRDARFDAGRLRVLPALERAGGRGVDVLLLSHAHADHVGGAEALLGHVPVGTVIEPAFPSGDSLYLGLLDLVALSGASWDVGRKGKRFTLDSVTFTVLHPDTTWPGWGLDVNEGSLVLLLEYGRFRALLAGDAGLAAESLLAGHVGMVHLLKVGHHGSRTATGDCWLAELAPAVAIVSAGRNNRYGHPARETLARLGLHRASIWRTDQEGAIVVTTDGRRVDVTSRARRTGFDIAPPPLHSSQESRGRCEPPLPPSNDSSSTRKRPSRKRRASSRISFTTSPSPPS